MLSFGFGMVATASSRNANQEMVPLAVKELHSRMSNYARVATGLASLVAAGTAWDLEPKFPPFLVGGALHRLYWWAHVFSPSRPWLKLCRL